MQPPFSHSTNPHTRNNPMQFARISIIDSIVFIAPMSDKDSIDMMLYCDLISIVTSKYKNAMMDFHLQQIFDVMAATGTQAKLNAFRKSDTFKNQQARFKSDRISEKMPADIASYLSEKPVGLSALSLLKESGSITDWIRNDTRNSSLRNMLRHVSKPTAPSDQSDRNLCLQLIAAFPDLKQTVNHLASNDLDQHSLWMQLLSQIP